MFSIRVRRRRPRAQAIRTQARASVPLGDLGRRARQCRLATLCSLVEAYLDAPKSQCTSTLSTISGG
eukprot:3569543-Heterocapsa_arctica.AAC.1